MYKYVLITYYQDRIQKDLCRVFESEFDDCDQNVYENDHVKFCVGSNQTIVKYEDCPFDPEVIARGELNYEEIKDMVANSGEAAREIWYKILSSNLKENMPNEIVKALRQQAGLFNELANRIEIKVKEWKNE